MLKTENCSWQALMDTAYDRWNANNDSVQERWHNKELTLEEARNLTWNEMEHLAACTKQERDACILGKLNQQIENGGVVQWVDNGYAKNAVDNGLFELLYEMGPISRTIADLLRSYLEDYMNVETGQLIDEGEEWEYDSGAHTVSDRFSDRFYELQELWHPEVYKHLEG